MNLVMNWGPLSEMTLLGSLCSFQMQWRNNLAVLLAVTVVCMGTKWAHLATESTTTMMVLKPCDSRSSMIKSTEMVSYCPGIIPQTSLQYIPYILPFNYLYTATLTFVTCALLHF